MNGLQPAWMTVVGIWQKIESLGVTSAMTYLEDTRIRMVNIIALAAFMASLFYGLGNLVSGYPVLTAVDLVFALATLFVFHLNSLHRHRVAALYLLGITTVFLSVVNFLSYNVAEYYLLGLLVLNILIFHHIWLQAVISVLLVVVILLPKYFVQELPYAHAVGHERLLINVPIAALFIFLTLRHFKFIQQSHQEELGKQRLHLEELNKDKEQLFAIVAHDIRSPLIATSQVLQMMREADLSAAQQAQTLDQIHAQLLALTENVDNLLQWSSQNLQGLVSRPANFPLHGLVLQVCQGMETQQQDKNIAFHLDIPADLQLFADAEQVRIILRNLLSNAIKFSYRDGEIRVKAHQEGMQVKIAITDFGTGMPSEKVKELFNSLQHPSYGTSGERGTGLGLLLVSNLVQINGGSISIESAENVGTTCHLLLSCL